MGGVIAFGGISGNKADAMLDQSGSQAVSDAQKEREILLPNSLIDSSIVDAAKDFTGRDIQPVQYAGGGRYPGYAMAARAIGDDIDTRLPLRHPSKDPQFVPGMGYYQGRIPKGG